MNTQEGKANVRTLASVGSRLSVLLASVCDYSSVGVEVQEMTKQEFWESIAEAIYSCNKCPARFDKDRNCSAGSAKSLQEAYERLECGEDGRE